MIFLYVANPGMLTVAFCLFAFLTGYLAWSMRIPALVCWTCGWGVLAAGLVLGSTPMIAGAPSSVAALHTIATFIFGFLAVAACRLDSGSLTPSRKARACVFLLMASGSLVALFLPRPWQIDVFRHIGASALFGAASLAAVRKRRCIGGPALRLTVVALAAASLYSLVCVPLSHRRAGSAGADGPSPLWPQADAVEMLFLFTIVAGSNLLSLETSRRATERLNRELQATRAKMESLAMKDPLTDTLTRNAFMAFCENSRLTSNPGLCGCVVVLDADNLKPVNDSLGHVAGDAALRAIADAVRSLLRPTDMLFRWGGDEFLVLVFDAPADTIRPRFREIDSKLAATQLPGTSVPTPIRVSYGLHQFGRGVSLEQAFEDADKSMYERKRARKEGRPTSGIVEPVPRSPFGDRGAP